MISVSVRFRGWLRLVTVIFNSAGLCGGLINVMLATRNGLTFSMVFKSCSGILSSTPSWKNTLIAYVFSLTCTAQLSISALLSQHDLTTYRMLRIIILSSACTLGKSGSLTKTLQKNNQKMHSQVITLVWLCVVMGISWADLDIFSIRAGTLLLKYPRCQAVKKRVCGGSSKQLASIIRNFTDVSSRGQKKEEPCVHLAALHFEQYCLV